MLNMENVQGNNMSDWSGNLYFFYSESEVDSVFKRLVSLFEDEFNYNCQRNDFLDEKAILFYRDSEMLKDHYENGYHLNNQGLGCVGIEAKTVSANGIAKLHTFDNLNNFDPYDIRLAFKNIYYYTLVLPNLPEHSTFSSRIYQIFCETLLNDTK